MNFWSLLLVGVTVLAASWLILFLVAARLPDGLAKELVGFLPACVTLIGALRKDTRVPRRAKLAVAFAGLWVLSPIDLIPEFLPVIGPLDDLIVVVLAFRHAARLLPQEVMREAWTGADATLDRILGRAR